jgi:hypothetical protein
VLTEQKVRELDPLPSGKTVRKCFDTGGVKGLYLLQGPLAKSWRLRYWLTGEERLLSLGPWPEVSLAEARTQARKIRKQLRTGGDPAALRRKRRASHRRVAREQKLERRRTARKQHPDRQVPTPVHPMPSGCESCGRPPSNGRYRLSRDHCHRTGQARGWLCDGCNIALGMLGDDLEGVENMRRYLLKHSQFAWLYAEAVVDCSQNKS